MGRGMIIAYTTFMNLFPWIYIYIYTHLFFQTLFFNPQLKSPYGLPFGNLT